MLEVKALRLGKGDGNAPLTIDFDLASGEVLTVLGANGAGKTTLLNALAGVHPALAQALRVDGRDFAALSRRGRADAGIGFIESGRLVFSDLTVSQNLLVATAVDGDAVELGLTWFPALRPRLDVRAASLSGGEQQMLVLARALVRRPRLLLIDELSHGLAPRVVAPLMDGIAEFARGGAMVILVEQFADAALARSQRALVLRSHRVVWRGPAATLRYDSALLSTAYFGPPAAPALVQPA